MEVEVIDLLNDGTGLGFGIIGGKSTGVVVKTILPGGVADKVCSGVPSAKSCCDVESDKSFEFKITFFTTEHVSIITFANKLSQYFFS